MSDSTSTFSACQEQVSKNSLNEIERTLSIASYGDIPGILDGIANQLRNSKNIEAMSRKDQIKYLCKLTGFTLEEIAFMRLYKKPRMTAQQLATQVGVSKRTLYRWPMVASLLSKRKDIFR